MRRRGLGSGWEGSRAGCCPGPTVLGLGLAQRRAAILPSEHCSGMAPRSSGGVRFAVVRDRRFLDKLASNEWGNEESRVWGWGGVVTRLNTSRSPFETMVPRIPGAVPMPQPPRAAPLLLPGPSGRWGDPAAVSPGGDHRCVWGRGSAWRGHLGCGKGAESLQTIFSAHSQSYVHITAYT